MKMTVCELPSDWPTAEHDWQVFKTELGNQASEWVLLPEMPFCNWMAGGRAVDPDRWKVAVEAHDYWIRRLAELPASVVIGSRPVIDGGRFFNEGFIWQKFSGYRAVHRKYYLPNEEGFWEASWYARGEGDFRVVAIDGLQIGFLICTELWFGARAREYARQGVHLLVCPRATPADATDKWIAGGMAAAVVAGAFCISSNFNGPNVEGLPFGGVGWVIEPEEGRVLCRTSQANSIVTIDIDPVWAEKAKQTYPRYVRD
ncbi:MAG: carbon-nitrogen hydrolase family protein [Desulfobacterales bacterium]|jgi:N-carbamoylputrescine amidase